MVQMMLSLKYPLMNDDPGQGGGSGGDPAPVATPEAPSSNIDAVLGVPEKAASSDATQPDVSRIPEKYYVKRDDGTLDVEASAVKLADAYGHLSKRLGTGDVRPESADAYTLAIPEALADVITPEDMTADPEFKAMLGDFHEAGFTQAQIDAVMEKYFPLLPELAFSRQFTPETARLSLAEAWGTEFDANARNAANALKTYSELAGIDLENKAIACNPDVMKLMAFVGKDMAENKPPSQYQAMHAVDFNAKATSIREEMSSLKPHDPRRAVLQKELDTMYAQRYDGKQ